MMDVGVVLVIFFFDQRQTRLFSFFSFFRSNRIPRGGGGLGVLRLVDVDDEGGGGGGGEAGARSERMRFVVDSSRPSRRGLLKVDIEGDKTLPFSFSCVAFLCTL